MGYLVYRRERVVCSFIDIPHGEISRISILLNKGEKSNKVGLELEKYFQILMRVH